MAITKWRFGALQTWDLNGCEQVAKPDRHADGGARDPQYLTKGGVAHRVEVESVRSQLQKLRYVSGSQQVQKYV
jgi:hypothetical protein